ncbi:MAG: InlB B-repeat-containing protein, partial [Coriobacteriia bacterium]|nr:InlB B-repeat-containing protein [Coriobacteriia bacterium]
SAGYGQHAGAWDSEPYGHVVTEDVSFTYTYPANDSYKVSYTVSVISSYAATSGAGSYEAGSRVTIAAGTRTGYTFAGWTVSAGGAALANTNAATTSFIMPTANVIVTANWTANQAQPVITPQPPAEISYTVTFVDWDGTVLSTQTVISGGNATAPAAPTREGYTFTGWDTTFTNAQSDITITAQYEKDEETIENDGEEEIDEPDTPLIGKPDTPVSGASWALVNLLLAIAGILLALVAIIRMVVTRRSKHNTLWVAATVIVAIVGIILFFLTEDMSNPMIMINQRTIIYAVLFAIGVVSTLLSSRSTTTEGEQTPTAT